VSWRACTSDRCLSERKGGRTERGREKKKEEEGIQERVNGTGKEFLEKMVKVRGKKSFTKLA
jgi:hypothetical protein